MTDDWEDVRLGDLIEIKHGFAFKGEYFTEQPSDALLLTPGNFAIGGGFQFQKLKFYKDGPIPADYILQPGDLLVTMTDLSKGGDTLGYSAVVPSSKYLMLHNQRLGKVTLKSDRVDLGFVHWLLRDDRYRAEVLGSATGSTVRHTSPKRIGAYQFRLPPLPEQHAIAVTLGALDDKIELNRRMNATLEETARALFRDWFVDFGPTRAKMAGAEPYLAPDLWDLFPDRLDEDGKPEGWEASRIGDEVRVVGGSTPSTKEPAYWDGGINWATPKDLSGLSSPVLLETSRTITDEGLAKIGSGLLPVGALLLSSRAPIGYLAVAEVPVAVNQGFIGMVCEKRVSNVFAWLWSLENMDAIIANANGSTFQEISKKNFRPLPVTIPGDPVLNAFDAATTPLYQRMSANERETRSLAETRDHLLPRLMSGEIRAAMSGTN